MNSSKPLYPYSFTIVLVVFLAIFTIYMPNVNASEWNVVSDQVIVDMNISGKINIKNPDNVDFIEVNLNYFPKDTDNQDIRYKEVFPTYAVEDESDERVYFLFDDLRSDEISYGVISKVVKRQEIKEISQKISFPRSSYPKDVEIYLLPTDTIDSNHTTVISKAREIAGDEDDTYMVVSKIAQWVSRNIHYSLSTKSVEASLAASWVLEEQKGVCDELTNLFIAMLRSVGIPARFVSGISYTSAQYIENAWGPHGWAEVYFEGVGWVPYDVTYQQYGYVDPTHIILSYSVDANEDSTNYRWKESGSKITVFPIAVETFNNQSSGFIDEGLGLDVGVFATETGIGSYNLVEVTLTNIKNSYTTPLVYLGNIQSVEIIDENPQSVILRPYEQKKIYWTVKTYSNMDKSYIYTIPINVYSSFGTEAGTTFQVNEDAQMYSISDFSHILNVNQEVEDNDMVNFSCTANLARDIYVGDSGDILCVIVNSGEKLDNVVLCMNDNCRTGFSIDQGEEIRRKFTNSFERSGVELMVMTLKHADFAKYQIVNANVHDITNLTLDNLEYPEFVKYDDEFNIKFILKKASNSIPRNVVLEIVHPYFSEKILLEDIQSEKEMIVRVRGSSLDPGYNNISYYITFSDDKGDKFFMEDNIIINLEELNFFQRLRLDMRSFVQWVKDLFSK